VDVTVERAELLIELLRDLTASLDERDDAAMDLGSFDGEKAVEVALAEFATDPDAPEILQSSAGESLAEIWLRKGAFAADVLEHATPCAHQEILGLFAVRRPEWLREAARE
jgi:hypothetical protein